MTTKGKSIFDFVDLTEKFFPNTVAINIRGRYEVMSGSPVKLMKEHGFTATEINLASRFHEVKHK